MPELPDVTVYVERIDALARGQPLEKVRIASPFLVRTFDPSVEAVEGATLITVRRLGKQIVLGFDNDLFLAIHLMIAGRLHWKESGARIPGKIGLAAFDFPVGTLTLTEASTKKRAAIHVVRGSDGLTQLERSGLEPLEASLSEFRDALLAESHTVKRSLTDPDLFSGIGNAYSDEILHRARLSPIRLTGKLTDEEIERLFDATRGTLQLWLERLRAEAGEGLPEKVTAFRTEMAVHGRYGKPCPDCGAPVQRIAYAGNECNYCARCQTDGKLLADRGLSRLLKGDWPKTLDELEARRKQ
ncbi:MAG TPA: DNA-formamidopyrimidine glycosylase family protein [Chloroflexota bacterium]|nr:DNA-formamidopyrimidine glycosylase family protein [Chloroflexota bacterium]